MAFIAVSLQIFWQNFYRNVPWVVLYEFVWNIWILSNCWIWLVHGNWKAKFVIFFFFSKIISSEAIKRMKLKLCRNVHNIRLYIKNVVITVHHVLLLLWQLSFHWLTMGKVKIGIYCYLTADILTKVFQKCLIGCHGNQNGNQRDKFAKTYSKIISSEAIRGMKLKLCRNVHNISLHKKYVFIAVAYVLFVAIAT